MQAFEEMVTNGERAKISTILCKFTFFLVCLAQKSHCFPNWQHFKGIFPRLLAAAGDQLPQSIADEANLLESLANTPALPHEPVNVSGVPVLLRTKSTTAIFIAASCAIGWSCHWSVRRRPRPTRRA